MTKLLFLAGLLMANFAQATINPQCRLLLGSGGFSGTPGGMAYLGTEIDKFLGPAKTVAIVGFAQMNPAKVIDIIAKSKLVGDREAVLVAGADAKQIVARADAILIFGGNTFLLLERMYDHDLLGIIRERVAAGVPYIGISAGTNVSNPTVKTSNDMRIADPPSPFALNLIPFQINPHYIDGALYTKNPDGTFEPYKGETREDRINEFHQVEKPENMVPVLGIPEAFWVS